MWHSDTKFKKIGLLSIFSKKPCKQLIYKAFAIYDFLPPSVF
jgi:hypothetical protein